MSASIRQQAVRAVVTTEYPLEYVDFKKEHVKDLFGVNVFNEAVQRERLPKPIFKALQKTIKQGAPLDPAIADAVATAMKDWAIEKGATHFTHHVPADDRPDRREARQLPAAVQRRQGHHRVQRQGAGHAASRTPRRSRPAASAPPSRPAATPPGTRPAPPTSWKAPTAPPSSSRPPSCQLDRRGARQEDAAAALDGGAVHAGPAHPAAVRQHRRPARSSPPSARSRNTS